MRETALELFRHQSRENEYYSNFLRHLNCDSGTIMELEDIPFFPIRFFKNYEIKTGKWSHQRVFQSSGTTGSVQSQHFIKDEHAYHANAIGIFEEFYGDIKNYCFLALLPGYIERGNSSLISMVQQFIIRSGDEDSGFYLNNFEELNNMLHKKIKSGQKTILWGVSHALMDFGETYSLPENEIIVMETGGMKGKRKELPKEELHAFLREHLKTDKIHSEYGMTELQSQLYSKENGVFKLHDRMEVFIRPIDDPLGKPLINRRGRVDIVDLSNKDTCSFIATDDLGIKNDKNELIIIGRMDNSDIRGCNLLYQ